MFSLSLKSCAMFAMVSLMWVIGGIELYNCITNLSENWLWLLASLVYGITISELFFHNIIGHQVFKVDTSRITYKLLIFLCSTSLSLGSIISMAIFHSLHHVYADQDDKDYLSTRVRWYTCGFLTPLMYIYQPNELNIPDLRQRFLKGKEHFSNIAQDPWTQFCDSHVILLTLIFWTVMYLVAPVILFKLIFLSRLLFSVVHGVGAVVGHNKLGVGYQNFKVDNNSHNNIIAHYLFLGLCFSMLHNNHHSNYDSRRTHRYRWFEIDTGSMIINYLLKPLLIKRHL